MSMNTVTREFPPALSQDFECSAHAVVEQIEATGSACLESVITPDWLARVRGYASHLGSDQHDTMLEGIDRNGPQFVRALIDDARLSDLLEAVAIKAYPNGDPADRRRECAIRVISGPDPAERPLWFHYDATVLTVVVPIVIPDAGPGLSGELVLYKNKRPYRRLVAVNVVEKLISQSDRYRKRMIRHMHTERGFETVALEPGNAYLFSGYRSYHATMPCPVGSTRVTVIIHYKDVHRGSRLLRSAKALYSRLN